MPMPPSLRISTVPSARKAADTSIETIAAGVSIIDGSKPMTMTPMKLAAIAVPVRQAKRSPNTSQASSADIGT